MVSSPVDDGARKELPPPPIEFDEDTYATVDEFSYTLQELSNVRKKGINFPDKTNRLYTEFAEVNRYIIDDEVTRRLNDNPQKDSATVEAEVIKDFTKLRTLDWLERANRIAVEREVDLSSASALANASRLHNTVSISIVQLRSAYAHYRQGTQPPTESERVHLEVLKTLLKEYAKDKKLEGPPKTASLLSSLAKKAETLTQAGEPLPQHLQIVPRLRAEYQEQIDKAKAALAEGKNVRAEENPQQHPQLHQPAGFLSAFNGTRKPRLPTPPGTNKPALNEEKQRRVSIRRGSSSV